jgi:hypothetical protein
VTMAITGGGRESVVAILGHKRVSVSTTIQYSHNLITMMHLVLTINDRVQGRAI